MENSNKTILTLLSSIVIILGTQHTLSMDPMVRQKLEKELAAETEKLKQEAAKIPVDKEPVWKKNTRIKNIEVLNKNIADLKAKLERGAGSSEELAKAQSTKMKGIEAQKRTDSAQNEPEDIKALEAKNFMINITPSEGISVSSKEITEDANFEKNLKDLNEFGNKYYQNNKGKIDKVSGKEDITPYKNFLKNIKSISFDYKYAPLLAKKIVQKANLIQRELTNEMNRAHREEDILGAFIGVGKLNEFIMQTTAEYNKHITPRFIDDFNDMHYELLEELLSWETPEFNVLKEKLKKLKFIEGRKKAYLEYVRSIITNENLMQQSLKSVWNTLLKTLPIARGNKDIENEFMESLSGSGCIIAVKTKLQPLTIKVQDMGKGTSKSDMFKEWAPLIGYGQHDAPFMMWVFTQANEKNINTGVQISPEEFDKHKENYDLSGKEQDEFAENFKRYKESDLSKFYSGTISKTFSEHSDNDKKILMKNWSEIYSNMKVMADSY